MFEKTELTFARGTDLMWGVKRRSFRQTAEDNCKGRDQVGEKSPEGVPKRAQNSKNGFSEIKEGAN